MQSTRCKIHPSLCNQPFHLTILDSTLWTRTEYQRGDNGRMHSRIHLWQEARKSTSSQTKIVRHKNQNFDNVFIFHEDPQRLGLREIRTVENVLHINSFIQYSV